MNLNVSWLKIDFEICYAPVAVQMANFYPARFPAKFFLLLLLQSIFQNVFAP